MNKYGAIKEGKYASKREAGRAHELKLLEKAGHIQDLREQVAFEIAPAVVINGRRSSARKYIADFVYTEDGKQVVEDVKGVRTDIYMLKRHMMKVVNNVEILET